MIQSATGAWTGLADLPERAVREPAGSGFANNSSAEQEDAAARSTRREWVERMVARHSQLVYRVAMAVVRNAADAEDVAQEIFLQLLRSQAGMEVRILDEPAYLARMAWRLAVRRKRRPVAAEDSEQVLARMGHGGSSPERMAIEGDQEAWLRGRIDLLPEKLRRPLALTALGELSSPQVAAVLGIPEGTVRRRVHTARQLLRKQMEGLQARTPERRKP